MTAVAFGADQFLPKSANKSKRSFADVLASVLVRAGREDHAHCDAMNREAVAAPAARSTKQSTLVLRARREGKRIVVELDAKPLALRKKQFLLVLRLVVARLRGGEGWVHRRHLGAKDDSLDGWDGIRRLNEDLSAAGIKARLVYDKSRPKHYRLPLTTSVAVPVDVDRIRGLLDEDDTELHETLDELERIQSAG